MKGFVVGVHKFAQPRVYPEGVAYTVLSCVTPLHSPLRKVLPASALHT